MSAAVPVNSSSASETRTRLPSVAQRRRYCAVSRRRPSASARSTSRRLELLEQELEHDDGLHVGAVSRPMEVAAEPVGVGAGLEVGVEPAGDSVSGGGQPR